MKVSNMARPRKNLEPTPEAKAEPAPEAETDGMIAVTTTGDFMLVDITTGASISHVGVTRVPDSAFIQQKIRSGELELA